MALRGTLETFGVSEIFQLISQQGKTGTLEIQTREGVARARFREGRLVEAWSDRRTPTELIGTLLVRAGLITGFQLDHALALQRENLRPIGDILIRTGAIRVAEFQEMLGLQHRETVYRLLTLRHGSYEFKPEPVELEEGISVAMDVNALLMEGFRQIDEWPAIRRRIPSENLVFLPVSEPAGEALSPAAALMLSLVDGTSPVRQLVDGARLGEFAGWEALAELVDHGTIRPLEASTRGTPARPSAAPALRLLADTLVGAVLLVIAAGTAVVGCAAATGSTVSSLGAGYAEVRGEALVLAARAEAWVTRLPVRWPARVTLSPPPPLPPERAAPVASEPAAEPPPEPSPEPLSESSRDPGP